MILLIAAIAVLAVIALAMMAQSQLRSGNQSHPHHEPTSPNAAANPDGAKNTDQKAENGADVKTPQRYWDRFIGFVERREKAITATSTIFIAAFTIILGSATVFLYFATRDLVTGSEKASARELRPYVWLEIGSQLYQGDPSKPPDRFAIRLTITNSGKSWARNLRIRQRPVINPVGDPFDPVELNKGGDNPIVLGPGQSIPLQFGDILRADLPHIAPGGDTQIFYTAWVTYDDAMSDPPIQRQTQLSARLNADMEGMGHLSFSHMPTHNCADDDCR